MSGIELSILNFFLSFIASLLAFIAWHHFDLEEFGKKRRLKKKINGQKHHKDWTK